MHCFVSILLLCCLFFFKSRLILFFKKKMFIIILKYSYTIAPYTTTQNRSGSGSNGNEWGTPYFPDFQNWILTIRYNLVLYSRHPFLVSS